MTYRYNIVVIFVLLLTANHWVSAAGNRRVTVEDCVGTRRIVGREISLSPTGRHVAYIVKAPDVKSNKNNYQLFVRDLEQRSRRENGRLLLQAEELSGLRWLADGEQVAVLNREGGRSTVRIVNIHTGKSEFALDHPVRIEEFSISADGRVIAFSTESSEIDEEEKRVKSTRGFVVAYGESVSHSWIPSHELHVLDRERNGMTKVRRLEFSGLGMHKENSLRWVRELNLSPDGRYLLFAFMSAELPEAWEATPFIRKVRELGGDPWLPALYDMESGQLGLAFNVPYRLGAMTWAANSGAFAIQSPFPVDSPEHQKEEEAAIASGNVMTLGDDAPLFAVDVEGGSFSRVLPKLRRITTAVIPLWWKHSNGPMLCRLDGKTLLWMERQGSEWKETSRMTLSLKGINDNDPTVSNGEVVIGVSETHMTPPDLFLYDIKKDQTTLLTDLNPEFQEISLGQIEELEWTNRYEAKATGYLIKPVGYQVGKQYPLVILAKSWGERFICDTGYRTAFPPQPLASAGFMVLMARDPNPAEQPKGYPGNMGEAYNWMATVEGAVDVLAGQGLVDKDRVGLVGFSRTSWKVDFMLTHSDFKFAAVSSADSGIYNYGGYWRFNSQLHRAAWEAQLGGPPYGKTLQNWLKYAPAFNAHNVRVPLLMEYTADGVFSDPSPAYEFFVALKRQDKPVELFFYPKGQHMLDTPFARVASLQRNVDWFRFWMQGYEGEPPDYDPDQYVRWRALRKHWRALK